MKDFIKSVTFSTVNSSEFQTVLKAVKLFFANGFDFFSHMVDHTLKGKVGLQIDSEPNLQQGDINLSKKFNTTIDNLVMIVMGWSSNWENIYLDENNNIIYNNIIEDSDQKL